MLERTLPSNLFIQLLRHLYERLLVEPGPEAQPSLGCHYCSLRNPCFVAHQTQCVRTIYSFRLVSKDCNRAFRSFLSFKENQFFQQVEAVYYPHEWHINTRVRRAALLGRFRVFRTIDTDNGSLGDRGVFRAYDFGSVHGCKEATEGIIKAWNDPGDQECRTERHAYVSLGSNAKIPSLIANAYDNECRAYVLALEKLGPTLEDLLHLEPDKSFHERAVIAAAIQLLEIYSSLHDLQIVHNGVKPANICLAGPKSSSTSLHLIDFGLSYVLDQPTPVADVANTVGNRVFLSVFGHHGISQSQRDDLESLGYLFSFLYHGSLPWFDPSSSHKRRAKNASRAPEIWSVKSSTPASVLFRGMHPCFLHYWKDVKSLAFGERPEYSVMKSYFTAAWEEKGFEGHADEFDWVGRWNDLQNESKGQKQ